jgi:glycosyltransferase involved in cell wall biosynthesis
MELTVVIPTRDRRAILREALARLESQAGDVLFEVIVVDDGSSDGTPDLIRELAERGPLDLRLFEQPGSGPSAARNRAIAAARAPVCLFLNDDSWPHPDLLVRHRDFHRRRPELEAALLGRIALPPDPPPTPFMRWLADVHFDYDGIADPEDAGGERFFTANVSAKTELIRGIGGFYEGFPSAAYEDTDAGLRLEERGMRLAYDRAAVVEHCHPLDLDAAIDRLLRVGHALPSFTERNPRWPEPSRPGLRHRLKAGALTGLAALGARTPRLQRETWRFLCHEATREAYWGAVDAGSGEGDPSGGGLRIGRRLARIAARDEDARLPA